MSMQDETQHVVQLSETPASASELSQVLVDPVDWPPPPPVTGRRAPDHDEPVAPTAVPPAANDTLAVTCA